EGVEGDLVSLADLAQHVLDRNLAVLEDERSGGAAPDPELVLLASLGEPGRAALDDHRGELLAVDLEKDDVHVGEAAVRDPHLAAVDEVGAAVRRKAGDRLRAQRVGTAASLRKRIGRYLAARGKVGEELRFLRGRAEEDDGQRADPDVRAERRRPRAVARLRFADEHRRRLVQT